MARRALVTGATGLVGSHIVEQLISGGWEVRGLARSEDSSRVVRALGAEPITGDVSDASSLKRACSQCDAVFHTAAAITAAGGWDAYRKLNVDGTAAIIGAIETSGARLLQLSSVAVYGSSGRYDPSRKTSEDSPLGTLGERSYYARSKRESEALVLEAHQAGRIWATAVRPCVIYGPRDRQFVPRMARALSLGVMPLLGGGRSTLAVVHAANVASGAILAVQSEGAGGRAYNLTNDFDVTVREYFRLASIGLERHVRFVPIPLWMAKAGLTGFRLVDRVAMGGKFAVASEGSLSFLSRDNPFTSERARRELGWAPAMHPADGIPGAFRWWRENKKGAT